MCKGLNHSHDPTCPNLSIKYHVSLQINSSHQCDVWTFVNGTYRTHISNVSLSNEVQQVLNDLEISDIIVGESWKC